MSAPVAVRLAAELSVSVDQVEAAVSLLDGGATVPFVARYRKEATRGLDDAQLRTLEERLLYLRELDKRREAVVNSVRDQGLLTDDLLRSFEQAETKARLEDLYLPYKPRQRTRAQKAREAGLEPLADLILKRPETLPDVHATPFVSEAAGVADMGEALAGARAILVERASEDADLLQALRATFWRSARIVCRVREGKEQGGVKFGDYFDFSEPVAKIASHRVLAVLRGEKEEVLDVTFVCDDEGDGKTLDPFTRAVASALGIAPRGRPGDGWLVETVNHAWRYRLKFSTEVDARLRLREAAQDEATRVFAQNVRHLLLAAPAGPRPTMGLDSGFRSGVKVG